VVPAQPKEQETASKAPGSDGKSRPKIWIAVGVAVAIVIGDGVLFALYGQNTQSPAGADNSSDKLSFVGSETCASCHSAEAALWQGSQHAHAMAHATKATVLGDFNDASFDHFGVHSRTESSSSRLTVPTASSRLSR
jgi:Cytochrome c554 and c-prime